MSGGFTPREKKVWCFPEIINAKLIKRCSSGITGGGGSGGGSIRTTFLFKMMKTLDGHMFYLSIRSYLIVS